MALTLWILSGMLLIRRGTWVLGVASFCIGWVLTAGPLTRRLPGSSVGGANDEHRIALMLRGVLCLIAALAGVAVIGVAGPTTGVAAPRALAGFNYDATTEAFGVPRAARQGEQGRVAAVSPILRHPNQEMSCHTP